MGLKSKLKTTVLGPPGDLPRDIRRGLLRGMRFNVDTASKSQRLLGLDEREIMAPVEEFAALGASALDIGANDGWYSLYFASRPNIQKVISFEPLPVLNKQLRHNFSLNGPAVEAKLTLVSKLVGNKDDAEWCSIDVGFPDLPRPIVFKIDVDGGEMDVLRGAQRTLSQDGGLIILETHSPELERDCFAFLTDLRYNVRLIKNGWYRAIVPESRILPHNRWLVAARD